MDTKLKFEEIFQQIDVNKDGVIDINEIRNAFKYYAEYFNAEEIINDVYSDENKSLNIIEFIEYMEKRNKKLKVGFDQMDKDGNGVIEANEIKAAMKDLGVEITTTEAKKLLNKLDKDEDFTINFDEWRYFLWMSWTENLNDVVILLYHSSSFDLGDSVAAIQDDFSYEDVINGTVPKTILSGVIGSTVARTLIAPLERLTVIRQSMISTTTTSILDSYKYMISEGGVRSMWRGNAINCFKMIPEVSIRSVSYWYYKSLLVGSADREISPYERLIAGSSAGATTVTFVYPLEVLKTRMTVCKTNQYKSSFDCLKQLVNQTGWKSLYRGYIPHMSVVIPFVGIDLTLFEQFKVFYMRNIINDKARFGETPPVVISLMGGALSSLCAQLITYPLALIRTRFQVSTNNLHVKQVFKQIIEQDGYRGLYRGMVPNLLKAVPCVSFSYAVFDQFRGYLGVKTY